MNRNKLVLQFYNENKCYNRKTNIKMNILLRQNLIGK